MLQAQVDYWKLVEQKRHDLATEQIQSEQNAINRFQAENQKSYWTGSLTETNRANRMKEGFEAQDVESRKMQAQSSQTQALAAQSQAITAGKRALTAEREADIAQQTANIKQQEADIKSAEFKLSERRLEEVDKKQAQAAQISAFARERQADAAEKQADTASAKSSWEQQVRESENRWKEEIARKQLNVDETSEARKVLYDNPIWNLIPSLNPAKSKGYTKTQDSSEYRYSTSN